MGNAESNNNNDIKLQVMNRNQLPSKVEEHKKPQQDEEKQEIPSSVRNLIPQLRYWKVKHANVNDDNSLQPGFDRPGTICGTKNNILVTDTFHNAIKQITMQDRTAKKKAYNVEEIFNSNKKDFPQTLLRPQGIAMASNGDIYIADTGHHMIKKLVSNTLVIVAGCGSPGLVDGKLLVARFNQPSGIAITSEGDILVADTDNSVVRKIYLSLGTVETITTWNETPSIGLYRPSSIALYKDNIFVSQPNHRIMKICDGMVSLLAGTGAPGNQDGYKASFVDPMGILYLDGFILVCDWGNHKIRAIDISSQYVITVAGKGDKYGPAEGSAKDACIVYPRAIGKASDGTIWISTSFGFQLIDGTVFTWRTQRLLWIGHLKNSPSECLLAAIPKEMITEIIRAANK